MLLKDLHTQIAAKAQNRVACALRLDWIVRILSRQIQLSKPVNYQFPTLDPKISIGLDFDMSYFTLDIVNDEIVMKGFRPKILIKEPQAHFAIIILPP